MIILGIVATLATFVFITALIFIFFEKTKKIGKQIAPISLVLALSLFFIMGALNRESHETKTEDVTAATESTEEEPMYSEVGVVELFQLHAQRLLDLIETMACVEPLPGQCQQRDDHQQQGAACE